MHHVAQADLELKILLPLPPVPGLQTHAHTHARMHLARFPLPPIIVYSEQIYPWD